MSIRTKLLAATVGLNGLILILALWLFIQSERESGMPYAERAELTRIAAEIGATGEAPEAGRQRVARIVQRQLASGVWHEFYVAVTSPPPPDEPSVGSRVQIWDAKTFYAAQAERTLPDPSLEVQGDVRERVARDRDALISRRYVYSDPQSGVLAVEPPHTIDAKKRTYQLLAYPHPEANQARTVYVFMIIGVFVLTAVLFWLVSVLVVHPLRELADAAEGIAVGDHTFQLDPRGSGDELDRTIVAFNRMAREIAEYQGQLEDRVLSALNRIKKAEQHLVIAQRLTATGKLAAGLAHEINNPLGGMKNAVRSLARGQLSPEKTAQYLELISDGLGRVEQTVKHFLSFTPRKIEARQADLVAVAEKALALSAHRIESRGIEIDTTFPDVGVALVYGDAHELQQVALNLLLNAADATPENSQGRISLEIRAGDEEVVLSVTDTGAGMAPEDQSRCFDMFFTTKEVGEGTGLGLAVVHNIVTNHGGRIDVRSEVGVGPTFTVHLPLDAAPTPDEERVA